ncbi:aliphatic sulfonate ABC transporter substrate-binding protein [Loigolactobacillus backii]|uniref:Putative aliphatic sulfonates-binding protein n=1 Tax=Loigolactobacillus backii TaxID=375175 RepID=A0A192H1I2_9LACO|nr:aliphatic sulfonate ABC transporter substrate-binding protein [Loigolactobacillus backii]ANK62097.1 nitrate ABC transporter substrate-binding protein [Loigolactobacillus backii]ANK68709.1 nitrate ABC transporter substrate-binding protein [Loigolactobacillus backii]MDA5386713.1 aliphatic sulfonate ABC transporter substrate-binding protein [Loigolactobacillus backii]MDA5389238.1 aliphatic sulfonate ABC transporter substrate-binding protein [Loigolactobacillus backii]
MRKRKKLILFLAFILIWAVVAIFGYSKTQANQSASSNLTTIRVGYQKGDIFDIARTQGDLATDMKKKGYKIVWKQFQSGSALLQALSAGELDYGRTGDTPPVTAQASGTKLVYIGAAYSKAAGSGILVPKGSSITSLAQLKGKKVAYSKGSSSHYLLLKALKKAGLKASDIDWVDLDPAAANIAFSKGKVDAWAIWDPYTAAAQVQQNATLLTNAKGLTTDRDFILGTQAFATGHRNVSKLLLKEMQKSMKWANGHHTELINEMSKSLSLPKSAIKKMVERRNYGIQAINNQIIKEQQDIADLFYQEGLISKKVEVKKIVLSKE